MLEKWVNSILLTIAFTFSNQNQIHSQCVPLLPLANPTFDLGGRMTTVSNFKINGGSYFATITPGANFDVDFNWFIDPTVGACPGCITYFHFGLSNVNVPGGPSGTTYPNTYCMGSVYGGQSSSSSGTFTAPLEDGFYYITLAWEWTYWCHQYGINHCNSAIIGLIQIGNPELLTVELDSLTHLTACESNDGSIALIVNDYVGCFSTNWSGPGGFSTLGPTSITGLSPGDYQVVVSDLAGCDTTLFFTINDVLLQNINIGNDTTLCQGESLMLNADYPGATFIWQDGSTNSDLNVSQPGIFWVEVSSGNCNITDSIQIDYTVFNVDLGPDTTLCNSSLLLDANTTGASYIWQNGTSNSTLQANISSTYWVDVSVDNCVVRDSIIIAIDNMFTVDLGNNATICGSNKLLDATTTNATYSWQNGSTSATYLATTNGIYSVTVSVGSCSVQDSIDLTFTNPFDIDLGNDTNLCEGNLILDVSTSGANYLWQDGSANPTFTVNSSGTYSVLVSTASPCPDQSDSILVVYSEPIQFSGIEDTTICKGDNFIAQVSEDNLDILWSDGSTASTNNFTQNGIYWVEVYNACEAIRDTFNVISIVCGCPFFLPSAFTPNQDNLNDVFLAFLHCETVHFEMQIYNRWGEEVFSSNNPMIGWNGTTNGKELEIDNYAWIIKFASVINGVEGDQILKKGMVQLIR